MTFYETINFNIIKEISNGKLDELVKKSDLDGFVKSSNSRRASFVIMRRTYRTLNDCEMQHNAEVGLFTRPSNFIGIISSRLLVLQVINQGTAVLKSSPI